MQAERRNDGRNRTAEATRKHETTQEPPHRKWLLLGTNRLYDANRRYRNASTRHRFRGQLAEPGREASNRLGRAKQVNRAANTLGKVLRNTLW